MSGRWWRAVGWTLLILTAAALIGSGIALRPQVWQRTEALRYAPDMKNAWNWGSRAAREGYFGLYDRVVADHADKKYGLDYVPLRLAVMTLWAKSRLAADPDLKEWKPDYAFNAPLLYFNTAMELLTALAVLMIARQWARRDQLRRGADDRWLRAEWLALIALALVWFNPASFLSAHGRPTWDVWVTPFFLWAIWLCCRDGWFVAGCLLGIGTMFKGQQLVVIPMFILWPMMGFRVGAIGRLVLGFVLACSLIVSPWIVGPRVMPIAFVVLLALVPLIGWAIARRWWRVSPRIAQWLVPTFAAIALVLCVPLMHGSMSWYQIGFVYGAEKFPELEVGGASSLAGILQQQWQWKADSPVERLTIGRYTPTISHVLVASYAIVMLLACVAMRRYERVGDARFVLAMATPWIVYFAIFPKMHERYLLWGALAACCSTIMSTGPVLLAILFSALSTIMSLYQMLPRDRTDRFLTEISPTAGQTVHDLVRPTYPGIGWAVLLATAIWVWLACAPAIASSMANAWRWPGRIIAERRARKATTTADPAPD